MSDFYASFIDSDLLVNVLTSITVVGIIAIVAGLLVAIGSIIFYVPVDTRIEQIYDLLPHFNCGACGTPGCAAMAEEVVEGRIKVEKCKPAKPNQISALKAKLDELGIKN